MWSRESFLLTQNTFFTHTYTHIHFKLQSAPLHVYRGLRMWCVQLFPIFFFVSLHCNHATEPSPSLDAPKCSCCCSTTVFPVVLRSPQRHWRLRKMFAAPARKAVASVVVVGCFFIVIIFFDRFPRFVTRPDVQNPCSGQSLGAHAIFGSKRPSLFSCFVPQPKQLCQPHWRVRVFAVGQRAGSKLVRTSQFPTPHAVAPLRWGKV